MDRATRILIWILAVAFAVSVVHYVDNYWNYHHYPQPGPGDLPAPPAWAIAVSWFLFTASGLAGLWWWLRRRIVPAALALAGYSLSGLVGLGHYLVPGAMAMPWWRHAHVNTDIVCGFAVLGFALWAVLTRRRRIPINTRERRA